MSWHAKKKWPLRTCLYQILTLCLQVQEQMDNVVRPEALELVYAALFVC